MAKLGVYSSLFPLLSLVSHYGEKNQLEKFIEELDELKEATQELLKNKNEATLEQFCGELADVKILHEQLLLFKKDVVYGLQKYYLFKIERHLQRIQDESSKENNA